MGAGEGFPIVKPADRHTWIVGYLEAGGERRVDVLNRYFVDAYVDATRARAYVMPYGADKCPQLGRDLSSLAALGTLSRSRVSITGLAGQGFPKWIWSYRLASSTTTPT